MCKRRLCFVEGDDFKLNESRIKLVHGRDVRESLETSVSAFPFNLVGFIYKILRRRINMRRSHFSLHFSMQMYRPLNVKTDTFRTYFISAFSSRWPRNSNSNFPTEKQSTSDSTPRGVMTKLIIDSDPDTRPKIRWKKRPEKITRQHLRF